MALGVRQVDARGAGVEDRGAQSGPGRYGRADIATLAAADVRARIGWLSQATQLFDDTIRNNLLLASPEADDAALWAALEAARIADVARALPDGLDTQVGGGARFSGGQDGVWRWRGRCCRRRRS